jgi:hypothetical protein
MIHSWRVSDRRQPIETCVCQIAWYPCSQRELAQTRAAMVLARSRMPPAASIFAKRTNGLVMASMGWGRLGAGAISLDIAHLIHHHGPGGNL